MLRVINYWMRRTGEARAIRELRGMTDRELNDLGIPRCDITKIVRHASET